MCSGTMGGCPPRDVPPFGFAGGTHTRGKTGPRHPARVAELQRDTHRRSR
ncbi:hypothetical protein I552_4892 [Mycobacterium xenopi 3993]|nr:hypothetical protein I552_4892 [Mycobacterium xenopi 3993]